ncbi:hypothetical protein Poli38472_013707 [Pythium oligandrum]|uniref:Choloylglycine hydrolase/NAAA C-terminal domain-containing protein n=1 Tax=Pythium oligandrum TaxID=41045 RepID=A0A8K1FHQ0_PYTOL|nr:hypothetical protein Poli38472_013707 [Pythium oligandrum]|eukprot:TMW61244.1 hypothetical protein Poli38472_013707 [Pythium oligandrum]
MRGVALVLAASLSVAAACSDFLLNTSIPSNVISARTMDFVVDLKTVVEVIPRGTKFQELPVFDCVECSDYAWESKYGFVAFNSFGLNLAADGLNERGLSAAWLYLIATEYPTPQYNESNVKDPVKPIVASVCSYLLGNYATVDEVRDGLKTIQIAEFDERIQIPILHSTSLGRVPLHVSIHDAQGKSLVIEFLQGQTKVYDNINHVLTNDPPLLDQLTSLQANGLETIPGGYGSTERFVRASVLNHRAPGGYTNDFAGASYMAGTEEQRGVSDALHIINTVVRPPVGEATEWSVVRDHARRKLYIQSTQNQLLRMIDLNQLDFSNSSSRHLIPITFGPWFLDVTKALKNKATTAKTVDLPPRTQLEQMLEHLLHNEPTPKDGSQVEQFETIALELTQPMAPGASSSAGFLLGVVCGAGLAVALMAVSNAATDYRRHSYRRIPDPETIHFASA